MTKTSITVFGGTKQDINEIYIEETKKLINSFDPDKIKIIYGGGSLGILGVVRSTWLAKQGELISVNLDIYTEPEIQDDYVFDNLSDRQKKLIELGDVYIVLPGSLGTHFELFDVVVNNQIGIANKPIFVLNVNNIFTNLKLQLEHLIKDGICRKSLDELNLHFVSDPLAIVL